MRTRYLEYFPEGLIPAIQTALPDNLTGVYLCGSLALGGFDPAISDVDILVVTERPMSDAGMSALATVHAAVPPSYTAPGRDYEVYYIDRATLRRFAPGQRHVKVGPDDPIGWTEHRPSWVIERWVVRERGVTLAGPDPETIIHPVSAEDMRWAAGEEIRRRLESWSDGTWPREDLAHLGAQAFEVETVCRTLHTVETGEASSKREAVAWASATLPERWHDLIKWSQRYKKDLTQDPARMSEALAFLRWALAGSRTPG